MQIRDKDGAEHDNKDEAIVPTDMNLICDDDLRLILNNMAQVCPHLVPYTSHMQLLHPYICPWQVPQSQFLFCSFPIS